MLKLFTITTCPECRIGMMFPVLRAWSSNRRFVHWLCTCPECQIVFDPEMANELQEKRDEIPWGYDNDAQ